MYKFHSIEKFNSRKKSQLTTLITKEIKMINSINNATKSCYQTRVVTPAKWVGNRVRLITAIGIGILLIAACINSSAALDLMTKNIKYLTIIVPIAYSLPAPLIGTAMVLTEGLGHPGTAIFNSYTHSVVKAWQTWFTFVGIA